VYLHHPHGLAVDGEGHVYVTEWDRAHIQKLSPAGAPLAQWSTKGADLGQLSWPGGLAVDESGDLYVADRSRQPVCRDVIQFTIPM
jgi:hypothetical protein